MLRKKWEFFSVMLIFQNSPKIKQNFVKEIQLTKIYQFSEKHAK